MRKLLALAATVSLLALTPTPVATQDDLGVASKTGVVVSSSDLAADVGAMILNKGGNAVDAAVATAFAMAVTSPSNGNIGGGGFMVIHRAGAEDVAIDYRETAPAAATRDISRISDSVKTEVRCEVRGMG